MRAGAIVLTTARTVPDELELPEMFIQADLSNSEGVAKVIKAALERLDAVDILVNNVGSSSSSRGDADAQ